MSSVRERVRDLDQRAGAPMRRSRAALQRGVALGQLRRVAARRRRAHPEAFTPDRADDGALATLRRDGVVVLPGLVDTATLDHLRGEFEARLDTGRDLSPPPDDASRSADQRHKIEQRVPPEVLARGQAAYRDRTNRVSMRDPLVTLPELLPLVFHEAVIDLVAAHFGSVPAVGSVTLRKSYANDLPVSDTLHWHTDTNSVRLLKSFVYLHDVGPRGGPFAYVKGSHRQKFAGWATQRRWDHEDIAARYPDDRFTTVPARAGDVIVANTTGFHRGSKPLDADRCMLTTTWVLVPEFGGRYPRNAVRAADLDRLTPKQRACADLLDAR